MNKVFISSAVAAAMVMSASVTDSDAKAPWKHPKGYVQTVVSDESDLNIYPQYHNDWHDMNVVNETGKMTMQKKNNINELTG